MTYRPVIVEPAEVDVDQIYAYILARSPQGATLWYRAFVAKSFRGQSLASSPVVEPAGRMKLRSGAGGSESSGSVSGWHAPIPPEIRRARRRAEPAGRCVGAGNGRAGKPGNQLGGTWSSEGEAGRHHRSITEAGGTSSPHLAARFGIEVLGFSVMSNHCHIILRNHPDVVAGWSDAEVARRWWFLFPQRKDEEGRALEPTQADLQMLLADGAALAE
jgi:hypothetical protein